MATCLKSKKGGKPRLALITSLSGIEAQSELCRLKLFLYRVGEAFKTEPCNNFYLEREKYYAIGSNKGENSAGSLRKDLQTLTSAADSATLLAVGNPARMRVNTEEDLLMVLQITEPPSIHDEPEPPAEVAPAPV